MSRKQLAFSLLVEKYRPVSVKDVILPSKLKLFFTNLVKEKEVPNLLFYSSSAGTGKTSTAKALVNDIKTDSIYINISLERGIDTLRSTIAKFATSYSMFSENSGKKICILDEFDGASQDLQKALRGFMEEFQDSCRFILTCNYLSKVIDPIQSRCQLVDFNVMSKEIQDEMKPLVIKRLCGILKTEKIEFTVETVEKIVEKFYPDIRKMINLLQQYSKSNGIIDSGIFNVDKVDIEFYKMILNRKLTDARKYLIEKNYEYTELYTQMYHNFIPMVDKSKQAQIIIILAEYQYKNAFSIDKELNAVACLLEIMGVL
jgi:DNA polymerase III delta prime subunit